MHPLDEPAAELAFTRWVTTYPKHTDPRCFELRLQSMRAYCCGVPVADQAMAHGMGDAVAGGSMRSSGSITLRTTLNILRVFKLHL